MSGNGVRRSVGFGGGGKVVTAILLTTLIGVAHPAPATGQESTGGDNDTSQTGPRFTAVSAGGVHSCGLRTDGSVVCWGANESGQADAPVGRFTAVSAGGVHSCGLRADGSVVCWGYNERGRADAPVGRFTAISAGITHSCGLRADGSVVCWGDNDAWNDFEAPAGRFSAVSAGDVDSCGLRADGSVVCWGDTLWAPAERFSAVSAGPLHKCGLRADGSVVCWGHNEWGLLDAPVGRFTAVSAGATHSCGLRADGSVVCWGKNNFGEADAPVGRFTAVSAGGVHSCGLRTDGSVVCWGANDHGQADAPVVAGSTPVVAQEDDLQVRINARRVVDAAGQSVDRVEFALQYRRGDDSWSARVLPRLRNLRVNVPAGRWYNSTPVTVAGLEVRINARRVLDAAGQSVDRVEFALQYRRGDDSWSARVLPRLRNLRVNVPAGRWYNSTPLSPGDHEASLPADRNTTVAPGDQGASRPADRGPVVTPSDEDGQLEPAIVEVANPHSWWQRPRGDLVVRVHMCVEPGHEHLATRELLDAHVRALNELHAPFYSWQSSGLLDVSFAAGETIIANDVTSHWTAGYLPDSCAERLGSTQAHVSDSVIMVGSPIRLGCTAWGSLGGPLGAIFGKSNADTETIAEVTLRRYIDGIRDTLDYNIGNPGINRPGGSARLTFFSPEDRGDEGDARLGLRGHRVVGTLAGFPSLLRREEGFTVYPCDFLEEQGWPVGPDAPACVRPGPPPVQDLRFQDPHVGTDGGPRITWRPPPSAYNKEPVTGYTVVVSPRINRSGSISDDLDAAVLFDLPADARSFELPPSPIGSPIGEYQAGETFNFRVVAQSAVGFGETNQHLSASVGFQQAQITIREIKTTEPRRYELSWPGSALVERWLLLGPEGTYWNLTHYPDGSGFSMSSSLHDVSGNSHIIREAKGHGGSDFIAGKSYELTVFGCLKDTSQTDSTFLIRDGCFPYATATFTPEKRDTPEKGCEPENWDTSEKQRVLVPISNAVTLTDTGNEGWHCPAGSPGCPREEAAGYVRYYLAEWAHVPGTTSYRALAYACTTMSGQCRSEYANHASDYILPDSTGTVTAELVLEYGTRFEVVIRACGPEDDANCPWSCPIRYRTEVIVPPREN